MKKRVKKIVSNNRVTKPLKISNKIQSKFIRRTPFVSINGIKGFKLSQSGDAHGVYYYPKYDNINLARVYSDEEQSKSETLYLCDSKNSDFLHRLQKQINTSELYKFYCWDNSPKKYLFYHANYFNARCEIDNEYYHTASDYCDDLESKPGFYILGLNCTDSDYESKVCYGYIINDYRTQYFGRDDSTEPIYSSHFILIDRESTKEYYPNFKSSYYKINYSLDLGENYNDLNEFLGELDSSDSVQCGMYLPFEAISSQIIQSYFMLEKLCGVSDSLNINGVLGDFSCYNKNAFSSIQKTGLMKSPRNYISMDTRGNIEYVYELIDLQGSIADDLILYIIVPDDSYRVSVIIKILDSLYSRNNHNRSCPIPYMANDIEGYDEIIEDLSLLRSTDRLSIYHNPSDFYSELDDSMFIVTNNDYREAKVPIIILGILKTTIEESDKVTSIYYFGTVGTDSFYAQNSTVVDALSNMNIPYDQNNSFGYRGRI